MGKVAECGVMSMETSSAAVTLTDFWPVIPLRVAVMVVVPTATDVIVTVVDFATVAVAVLELDHVAVDVISLRLPSE